MKKRSVFLFFVCLLVLSSCESQFAPRAEEKKVDYSETTLIVTFVDDVDLSLVPKYSKDFEDVQNKNFPRSIVNIFSESDVKGVKRLASPSFESLSKTVVFEVEGNILEIREKFEEDPNVLRVSLDYDIVPHEVPNDPLFPFMWALNNIGQAFPLHPTGGTEDADIDFPEALNLGYGTEEVVVAVIDSGIDYNHPDLVENVWNNPVCGGDTGCSEGYYGYDFLNGDSDPLDDHGHGTHCSGIIAAELNNSIGISGVCPNCKIMGLKVLPDGQISDSIAAFSYAVENDAKILSNSWGCTQDCNNPEIEDAIKDAFEDGILVVFSAGNNDINLDDNYLSPQSMTEEENLLVVGSSSPNDIKSSFSNYGTTIDLVAPGSRILSLRASNTDIYCYEYNDCNTHIIDENGEVNELGEYYVSTGTSMAAPHVSGIAGLLWSHYPDLSNVQIMNQLKFLSDDIYDLNPDYIGLFGEGRLNALNSLSNNTWLNHSVYVEEVEVHDKMKIGDKYNFSVKIINSGESNESNLSVLFKLDEVVVDNITIENISVGSEVEVQSEFNSSNLYYNDLSIEVLPVQGEISTLDNELTKEVWVYNYDASPIEFAITNNYVLDCEEQGLNPLVGKLSGAAIYANIKENITVKNCKLFGWHKPIEITNSENFKIINNTVAYSSSVSQAGIYFADNKNGTVSGNVVAHSSSEGMRDREGTDTLVDSNFLLCSSSKGLRSYISVNDTFTNNYVVGNEWGIYLTSSDDMLVESNVACDSNFEDFYCDGGENNNGVLNTFEDVASCSESWPASEDYSLCSEGFDTYFDSCEDLAPGCSDSGATNYDSNAHSLLDDGTCLYAGCNDLNAENYNSTVDINDGSCVYNFSATIGGDGGIIDYEDDVIIVIPQNDLGEDVDIEISNAENETTDATLSSEYNISSNIYALTPHGLSFNLPVTISLDYGTDSSNISFIRLDDELDTTWDVVEGGSFSNGIGTLEINGFSIYAIVEGPESEEENGAGPGDDPDGGVTEEPSGNGGTTNGNGDEPIDFYVNESETLNLSIEPLQDQVVSGSELQVYVNISKESEDNSVHFDIGIFDQSLENQFSSNMYVFYVENDYNNLSSIEIPENISVGNYVLKANAYFSEGQSGVVSVANIRVVERTSKLLIFSITLFVILAILVIIFYYFYKRRE